MNKPIKYVVLLVGLLFLFSSLLQAQNGDKVNVPIGTIKSQHKNEEPKKKTLPIVGLGVGPLTFYGDVERNTYYKLFNTKFGYDLSVRKHLTHNFSVSAHLLYGRVFGEERSPIRNLNFISPIVSPYVSAEYALNRVKKYKIGYVSPYFSIGTGLVYFHPKGDLLDANGNTYYYWMDGSIRNTSESGQDQDTNAVVIYRDYKYETDLRKANLDSIGKYPLISLAMPVGIGLNCKVSPKITVKLSTIMHFTTSDLIDNVNVKSVGMRKGKAGFDKYLFSSVTLSYNLNDVPPDRDEFMFNGVDLLSLSTDDTDGDGINDFDDECPDTPTGIEVDSHGCPFDDDYDGVPNYKDKQRDTPLGAIVDTDGVQLKDEDIERMWNEYAGDSTRGIPKEMYTVQLGIFKDGIPKELLDKFLRIEDLESAILEDSSVIYFSGRYYTEDGAAQGLEEIKQDSILGAIIVKMVNGKFIPVGKPDTKLASQKAKQDSLTHAKALQAKIDSIKTDTLTNATKDKKLSSIEMTKKDKTKEGTAKDTTKTDLLKNQTSLIKEDSSKTSLAKKTETKTGSKADSSKTTTVAKNQVSPTKEDSSKTSLAKKTETKTGAKADSSKTTTIAKNQVSLTKEDSSKTSLAKKAETKTGSKADSSKTTTVAKNQVNSTKEDSSKMTSLTKNETKNPVTESTTKGNFTIQLAEYKTAVPQEDVKKLMGVKGIQSKKSEQGETSYTVGDYKDKNEANKALEQFKKQGFSNAKVIERDKKQDEMLAQHKEDVTKTDEKPNSVKKDTSSAALAKDTKDPLLDISKKNITDQLKTVPKDSSKTQIITQKEKSTLTNLATDRTGQFAVLLGQYDKEVPQDVIDKFLSVPDIMSTKLNGITYYTTKTVSVLSEAQKRLNELKGSGFSGAQIVEFKGNSIVPYKGDASLASLPSKEGEEKKVSETKAQDEKGTSSTAALGKKGSDVKVDSTKAIAKNEIPNKAKTESKADLKTENKTADLKTATTTDKTSVAKKDSIQTLNPIQKNTVSTETKSSVVKPENKDNTAAITDKKQIPESTKIETKAISSSVSSKIVTEALVFRVQLGAFVNKSTNEPYTEKGITDVISFQVENYTKYFTGVFNSYDEARDHKVLMQQKGFADAFVTVYKDGKRIEIKDAINYISTSVPVKSNSVADVETTKSNVVEQVKEQAVTKTAKEESNKSVITSHGSKTNSEDVVYKVQLGAFKNRVPSDLLGDIQSITAESAENGYTRFMYGHYSNYDEAKGYATQLQKKGYSQAFVVPYKKGKRISLEEVGISKNP